MKPPVVEKAAIVRGSWRQRISKSPLLWLLPLIVIVAGFYLYPALEVIRFSFTNATLLNPRYRYTLNTYLQALGNPDVPGILIVTVIFVFASVFFQLAFGLLIAMAVQRGNLRNLPGTVFLRTIILSAWIVPGIAAGIIWQIIFNEANYGLLTATFKSLGLPRIAFLSDPDVAIWSAVVANVWRGTAFSMILLYAGLQAIPREYYEAAEVDGASGAQAVWHITLPQLRPVLLTNVILITIATFNTFDLILPLTGGGPGRATEVLALYTYNIVFRNFDLAGGSVLAVTMLLISLVFTAFYTRLMPREELE